MFKKRISMEMSAHPPFSKRDKRTNRHCFRIETCLIAFLSFVLLPVAAFGQSQSIGGTIIDASKSVIAGAEVMVSNEGTGVVNRTTTNNSGVYNFPSLPQGTYTVTVEARGFQRAVMSGVRIGIGAQFNLPFELMVVGTITEVEVSGVAESIILESGSSTGTVVTEEIVAQMPLLANDALDMLNIMGGVVASNDPVMAGVFQTVAGVTANNINISRDGISVNEIRYNVGIQTPSRLNPELVGEFQMILSPVDAELGRGAGQIRMTTRSGTNAFHASGVWTAQNTVLDSYSYNDKNRAPQFIDPLPWRNRHAYTLTASGPIVRNKTFFFVSWDQQIARSRTYMRPAVLTNCARKGIYRWFGNTVSGHAGFTEVDVTTHTQTTGPNPGISPQRPVVRLDGTPYHGYVFPNDARLGTFAGLNTTGTEFDVLHFQSVLGPLSQDALRQVEADPVNCSQYLPTYGPRDAIRTDTDFGVNGNWDNFRTGFDQSGYVSRFNALMPPATDFQVGDGLNTAGHGWIRRLKGSDSIFGQSVEDSARKAITVKIDHNITSDHRLSGTYSYEVNSGEQANRTSTWPAEYGGYGNLIDRRPQTFMANLVSTLRPTLLNEFRVGMSRTASINWNPLQNPRNGSGLHDTLVGLLGNTGSNSLFPEYNDMPVVVGTGSGGPNASTGINAGTGTQYHPANATHPWGGQIYTYTWGGHDPRWTVNNTIAWMRGAHSFRGGIEYRWQQSWQRQDGVSGPGVPATPQLVGGVITGYSPQRNLAFTNVSGNPSLDYWPNMPKGALDHRRAGENPGTAYNTAATASGPYAGAYNLLTYMSGSIASVQQFFHAVDARNPRWNDPRTDGTDKISDLRNREFSAFFKDDWKITRDLTLNLGVRWEYYGVPWENNGMAAGIAGGISGAMGISKGDLNTWMPTPDGLTTDLTTLTDQILVGPNSPNPGLGVHGKDLNNFAPHVGMSWQLPWFGRGMTTLRAGYSISYVRTTNFDQAFGYGSITYQPTMVYSRIYNTFTDGCASGLGGSATGCYLDLTTAGKLLPLYTESKGWVGMEQQPAPLQKQWVGKRDSTIQMYDPDIVNPYIQNLNMSLTRQVGRALTVDVRYIATLSRKTVSPQSYGINLNTNNLINSGLLNELVTLRRDGPTTMGSPDYDNLSKYPILDGYIKPGTYVAGATNTGSQQVWSMQSAGNLATGNVNAIVTAISNANCAAGTVGVTCQMESGRNAGNVLKTGGAPDNLIIANPQYAGVNIFRNGGTSNYHSMQAQLTMRPMYGLNFQTTYTWSRTLVRAGIPVDYTNWLDHTYNLSDQHRSHVLAFNGSYSLPFGQNGFILRTASGALKKVVEGWNVSWMGRVSSGVPMSLGASANSLWNSTRFDQVGPFDRKQGTVEWDLEHNYGYYMGRNKYDRVVDPQCFDETLVHPNMRNSCGGTLRALIEVDPDGSYDGYSTMADYNAGRTVTGNLIFVNPKPGTTGNFRPNSFTGPGRFTLDANMGKTINLLDGKSLEIRVDAQNVLNHATPSNTAGNAGAREVFPTNPPLTINTTSPTPFGQINTKAGRRTFQARLRLSF